MDVVTPDNLNIGFLREFMMLPTSYYETGAAIKFRKLKKNSTTLFIDLKSTEISQEDW